VIPQLVLLQVAYPLAVGAGHGVQETVPQEATLALETHAPEQRCVPERQEDATQVLPEQVVPVMLLPVGHAAHTPPQNL
jgi:hypothetical protein